MIYWNYEISCPCFYKYWPLPSWSCCFPVWPGSGRTGTPVWSHVSYHCSRLFSAGKDTNLNPHIHVCNMMSKKKLVAISRCMNDTKMISMRKILWKWIQLLSNFSSKIFFLNFKLPSALDKEFVAFWQDLLADSGHWRSCPPERSTPSGTFLRTASSCQYGSWNQINIIIRSNMFLTIIMLCTCLCT